jgi:Tfp pilus assembly protein PilV
MRTSPSRRQRGITLLEALIAFLVLSLGMLAIARLQTHLRLDAEIARQRSEAVRLAQQDIESMRAFALLSAAPGTPAFAAITAESRTVDASGNATNTAYRVTRQLEPTTTLQAKSLRVTVDWHDRAGDSREVALASVIAGTAPAFSGALGLARSNAPARGAFGRSARIPLVALDLGDGRSAFKPVAAGTVALVFDNASGRLVGRCAAVAATTTTRELTRGNLGTCDATMGHLLSGVVRFAAVAPAALEVVLALTGGPYPVAPACSAEAVVASTGDRHVAYHCAVYPAAGGRWSGRATLVPSGWTIGARAADRRVCRYTADLDGSGAIDANIEHPDTYIDADAGLANQDYLFVAGDAPCPAGRAVQVAGNNGDVYVDLSTAPHQP